MNGHKVVASWVFLATVITSGGGQKLVLTNDDGWAVAQIRAEYEALVWAGYDVRLHAHCYTV